MDARRAVRIAALCIALAVVMCLVVNQAYAAKGVGGGTGGDKSLASKTGMGALDGAKKETTGKSPSKAQMMIGVGSLVVAIIVIKWL